MTSSADTLIFLPNWASEALTLKGMNVYINPRDNDEYVVIDTASAIIAPIGTSPRGTVEYDQMVFEKITQPIYRHDDSLHTVIKPQEPPAPFDLRPSDTVGKKLKRKRRRPSREEEEEEEYPKKALMTKLTFATHFLNDPDQPEDLSVKLLGNIYDVIECFEINQMTLDVVNAVIQFVYTKSLQNTMGCVRRNKRFKSQMQYILNQINVGRY